MTPMNNVADLMASGMASDVLLAVRLVAKASEDSGAIPYLVGGWARDLIIGAPASSDLDIALVGSGSDAFDLIARRARGDITKRSQFNTVAMRVGVHRFDLTMARSESYPSPGSLPVIRQGTLAEDLARRDFSVNAMAISLAALTWGDLYDPEGGLNDLRNGTMRVLRADSFRDDATRILRAARYSSRLSLQLSSETRDTLMESVGSISYISPARARDELERVFMEGEAAAALGLLEEWGALTAIHPALKYDAGAWTLFSDRTGCLSERNRVAVGYAIFGAGMRGADVTGVVARLAPGSLARRALRESAELAKRISGRGILGLSNSSLAEILDTLSERSIAGCAIAASGSAAGRRLDEYLRSHRGVRSELTGDDIIALGVERGPEVGIIQRRLRSARLDGFIASREEEEAFVQDRLKASQDS